MASAVLLSTFVASTAACLYLVARPLIASRQAQAQARAEDLAWEAINRDRIVKHLLAAAKAPAYRTGPPKDPNELLDIQFIKETPYSNRFRVFFGSGLGAFLQGLPACGGFYTLSEVTGIELDFLGFDRFQSLERPTDKRGDRGSAEEEAFCDKLRLLGAEWLPNEDAQLRESDHKYIDLYIGWEPLPGSSLAGVKPGNLGSAGVWVLMLPRLEACEKGTGILNNARSMEERCRLLERLGAKYYKDPKECPDLNLP